MTQVAYEIQAATRADLLERCAPDLWETGAVSSAETLHVPYAGLPLGSRQDVVWRVRLWTSTSEEPTAWSRIARFRTALDRSDWRAAFITLPDAADDQNLRPSPLFRTRFHVEKNVTRALAHVTALGLYEFRVNGGRAGDQVLAPEWTDYIRRLQVQTVDVTSFVRRGDNMVTAVLADGWYAGRLGHVSTGGDERLRGRYGRRLALLFQLEVEHADGSIQLVVSDRRWHCTTDGPIRSACLMDGEVYDARRETADESAWSPVGVLEPPACELVPQPAEPVRVIETLPATKVDERREGVYVADLGQEISGWSRVRLTGWAGVPIRLRHAERLDDDGALYTDNLRIAGNGRGARCEDQIVPAADGEIVWEPRFTYRGFRYVEITGAAAKPAAADVEGRAVGSSARRTGAFECSDALLNRLMESVAWTLRSNMPGIPTDCPQRDERLGFLGDMLVFAQTAMFTMDVAAFLSKWLVDIRDAQVADGRFPDFAPHPFEPEKRFSGVPGWGDAGVVLPWRHYVAYGDPQVLEEHFDPARRWVDWVHARNPNLLWGHADPTSRHNDYGDWLSAATLADPAALGLPEQPAEVPRELFATAQFHRSAATLSKMARVLGRVADCDRYAALAERIRAAFQEAYVADDGTVLGDTQAGYALALHLDLAPPHLRGQMAGRLVALVEAFDDHLSTGIHTTPMLLAELERNGRVDLAYRLLLNRTCPSWGFMLDNGGTTIWERWDGYVQGRGYQNVRMNSFCHYALGAVGEWVYRHVLGINPVESAPGAQRFGLGPRLGGGLTFARGSYDSVRGRVESDWALEDGTLTWRVLIPANTEATVHVPAVGVEGLRESGRPVRGRDDLWLKGMDGGTAVLRLGSGEYEFRSEGIRSAS